MFDYELQQFETLARDITADDAPLVYHQTRDQKRFVFNLDYNKPQEKAIGQGLNVCKRGRKMTEVIRNAVRLYFDLAEGRTDVLCELFPGMVAAIRSQGNVAPQPSPLKSVAPLPADDLPALVMTKAASDGKAASGNFLSSCANLQS